jgi:hypothetical protein
LRGERIDVRRDGAWQTETIDEVDRFREGRQACYRPQADIRGRRMIPVAPGSNACLRTGSFYRERYRALLSRPEKCIARAEPHEPSERVWLRKG